MDRIALAAFVGLFSLPFLVYSHLLPLPSFYTEWLAGVLAVIAIAAFLGRKPLSIELPRILLLPFGMVLLLVAQLASGWVLYPGQGRLALLYLLCALLLMIASRSLSNRYGFNKVVAYVAWAMVLGGIANGLVALVQWGQFHSVFDAIITGFPKSHYYGNLGQANHFADHQALALTALLYLTATRRMLPWLGAVLCLVLLMGLALSGSRSGWLYLAVLLALSFLYWRQQRNEVGKTFLLYMVAALIGFALIQQGLANIDTQALSSTDRILAKGGEQLGARKHLWLAAWNMFIESPLIGGGYQNFAWHYFQHLANLPGGFVNPYEGLFAENAHNLPLQLLAEFGIGAGLLLAGLAYWLFQTYRKILTPERWLVLGMLAVIGVHSMLEYPLHHMHFLAIAAVLLALASDDVVKVTALQRIGPMLVAVMMIFGMAVLAMLYTGYKAVENLYQMTGHESAQALRSGALLEHLNTASRMGFFEPVVDGYMASVATDHPDPKTMEIMLGISGRVMHHKTNSPSVYRHILLLSQAGQFQDAEKILAVALRVYPKYRGEFEGKIDSLLEVRPGDPGLLSLRRYLVEHPVTERL